ncbi:MAG: hypothetical protein KDA47_11285, partial [Planctomycetales bacterium]|nr:hypothetical protein [Planctomycetales bacterium]
LVGLLVVTVLYALWRTTFQAVDPRLLLSPPSAPMPTPAALSQIGEIDVRDMPFNEAVDALAERYGFEVAYGRKLVPANKVSGYDKEVTLKLSGVSVRSLLYNLSRLAGYDYLVVSARNGMVVLTVRDDWEASEAYRETRVYPPSPDNQHLATWMDEQLELGYGGNLGAASISSCPREFHERRASLCQHLNRRAEDGRGAYSTEPIYVDELDQPGNARIRTALRSRVDLDIRDMRIPELAELIAKRCDIPVLFDPDFRYPHKHPVRFNGDFRNVSLAAMLEVLLDDDDVEYSVWSEVLWLWKKGTVTQFYVALREHAPVVYPVKDLVSYLNARRASGKGELTNAERVLVAVGAPRDQMTNRQAGLLRVGVEPEWWSELDDFIARPLQDSDEYAVVVCDERRHQKIQQGLDALRAEVFPPIGNYTENNGSVSLSVALQQSVALNADESILEFGRRLARDFGISVCVHERRSAHATIRGVASRAALGDAINHLLSNSGFVATPVHNVLLIAPPDLRRQRTVRCYRLPFEVNQDLTAALSTIVVWRLGELFELPNYHGSYTLLGDLLLVNHDARVHQTLELVFRQMNLSFELPIVAWPTDRDIVMPTQQELVFHPAAEIISRLNESAVADEES